MAGESASVLSARRSGVHIIVRQRPLAPSTALLKITKDVKRGQDAACHPPYTSPPTI